MTPGKPVLPILALLMLPACGGQVVPPAPGTSSPESELVKGRHGRALRRAARAGRAARVQALLADGADPDADDPNSRKTALHWAALNGHQAVVKLLVAAGADVTLMDGDGFRAADLARANGEDEIEQVLKKAGAGE